jgi:hypothetical protein
VCKFQNRWVLPVKLVPTLPGKIQKFSESKVWPEAEQAIPITDKKSNVFS